MKVIWDGASGSSTVPDPTGLAGVDLWSTTQREFDRWLDTYRQAPSARRGNLLAALGLAQLRRLDELVAAQRQVNAWYRDLLIGKSRE